jgi:hypothetical protein
MNEPSASLSHKKDPVRSGVIYEDYCGAMGQLRLRLI